MELKELLEKLHKAWQETQRVLAEVEAGRGETSEQKEKLQKLEVEMSSIEKKMEEIQVKTNRPGPAGGEPEAKDATEAREKKEKKEVFFKHLAGRQLSPAEMKTMVLADEASLGFLAPPEWYMDILKNLVQISPVRQFASQRTVSGRELHRPKRTTTLSATWVGEAQLPGETKKNFGELVINANKLAALAIVSQDSLQDISFLEADLRDEFDTQFALAEGQAFLSGNGVEKPFGILDSNSGVFVRTSANSGQVGFDDLITLMGDLKEQYWSNATWFFSRATLTTLRKQKDANGQYLWQPAPALGAPATILDRPFALMPDMDSVAAGNKPIIFGDMRRGYMIVDRMDMAIQIVRELYLPSVGYFATRRVGGQVQLAEALKILKVKS